MPSDEFEELIKMLQVKGSAHAHVAGKAQFYLKQISGKPNARFSNCSRADFIQLVNAAVYKDEWKPLDEVMGRWW